MKTNRLTPLLAVILVTLLNFGCTSGLDEDITYPATAEFAIPLVNADFRIADITDNTEGNTSVRVDADGKVTVLYEGELVRNFASSLFPPFPGIFDNVLTDTFSLLELPLSDKYIINKAVFKKTNMFFRFTNQTNENIIVTVNIPKMTKNGESWRQTYLVPPTGTGIHNTPLSSIDGWRIETTDNKLAFQYFAINGQGERLKLDYAAMRFDVLEFSYIEGYFGNEVFEIQGNIISVGLFKNWISGGMDFDNPSVAVRVENAFGFPVRSRFNNLRLTTVNGNSFDLQSELLTTGINFDYPRLNEIGQVKNTFFAFDKTNSNLRELFNDKTVQISYDIDAIANPDNDQNIIGFISENSFFSVNVAVEVPLLGKANQFTLGERFTYDFSDVSELEYAEFKSIVQNDFPIDIRVQAYFEDQNGAVLDSLFAEAPLLMPSAQLGNEGKTIPGSPFVDFEEFNSARLQKLRSARSIFVKTSLNNPTAISSPLWIYDDYKIGFKLGVITKPSR